MPPMARSEESGSLLSFNRCRGPTNASKRKNRTLRRQGELMTSLFSLLSACRKAGLMEEDDLYEQL